jgi:uncharacterized membrane protein YjjB (DUF3815 family)
MTNLELLKHGFWGFIATAGFGVLFNVPTRLLIICGFTGAMGHMWRRSLIAYGVHPAIAAFFGALIVGMLGYSQARMFHMPRAIFTVTGIISMVPGTAAFETIVYFLNDDIDGGVRSGVQTGLIVGAIASGLVAARLLVSLGDTTYTQRTRGLWLRVTTGK